MTRAEVHECDVKHPVLSILIPASNEAATIATCLDALAGSTLDGVDNPCFEILVIANACTDDTVSIARSFQSKINGLGWNFQVIERVEGGKLAALNAGERVARSSNRVFLDADVVVSAELLGQISMELAVGEARYVSGTLQLAPPETYVTSAYARIYRRVPFMTEGVPGCGLFAVNAAGRMRWGAFPDIISDDTFVRLQFQPKERRAVPATFTWPLVEGWRNLVKVRRRQNVGVDEIAERFPELLKNDDKPDFGLMSKLKLAVSDPIGFAVYAGVALAVKLPSNTKTTWTRGR